jgi:hypothetical protein
MKLCVLVAGEEALEQAGARIRYARLQPALRTRGHQLELRTIDSFESPADFVHDAYVMSKIHDVRSLVAARLLVAAGIPVGADLFDDYFTQRDDTRLGRFQQWLDSFAPFAAFMLCSTPALQRVAERQVPGAPVLMLNDTAERIGPDAIRAAAERKLAALRQSGLLRVGWFGMGDNPYFPVGLHDLARFGDALAALCGHGFDVALSIATNRRALTPPALAALSRLPVPFEIVEWSEAAERRILDEALVCVLPVGAQPFSVAKSLNRAVTCLTGGAQVLSLGYPLYDRLSAFIYRDPAAFVADLRAGKLAVRGETLPALAAALHQWADPDAEAQRLADFLASLPGRRGATVPRTPRLAVVHGQASGRDRHLFARRMGAVSAASPFARQNLKYDIRFVFQDGPPGLAAHIADTVAVSEDLQDRLAPDPVTPDSTYRRFDLSGLVPGVFPALGLADSLSAVVACYGETMAAVAVALRRLLPDSEILMSEDSHLPFRALPAEGDAA